MAYACITGDDSRAEICDQIPPQVTISKMENAGDAEAEIIDPILIEHAVRVWDAERENSARLSGRSTLLMTALAALFGLGLYRIDWFRGEKDESRIPCVAILYAIKLLLGFGLLSLGLAFGWILAVPIKNWQPTIEGKYWKDWFRAMLRLPNYVLWKLKRASGYEGPMPLVLQDRPTKKKLLTVAAHASEMLRFPPSFFDAPPPVGDRARKMVLSLVYDAALYLQDRNGLRKKRQDQGQQLFVIGLALIGLAILVYIFGSQPPIIR